MLTNKINTTAFLITLIIVLIMCIFILLFVSFYIYLNAMWYSFFSTLIIFVLSILKLLCSSIGECARYFWHFYDLEVQH